MLPRRGEGEGGGGVGLKLVCCLHRIFGTTLNLHLCTDLYSTTQSTVVRFPFPLLCLLIKKKKTLDGLFHCVAFLDETSSVLLKLDNSSTG